MPGGVADGGHNSRGRGQHQGAGAEHNKDGHGPDNLAGNKPGQHRRGQSNDHDPGSPAVGNADDLRFSRVRRLHQADHPLDGAVLADFGGLHFKGTELIHRAAGYGVPHGLIHRQGFAGHDRLVDGGLAGTDHTVHRHPLAGKHSDTVAELHLLGGDDLLPAAAQHPGGLGRQMDQLFNAGPGPGHSQLLQQAAQLHDERHLSGGEGLADANRGNQRQRHQHIRLDVKGRHKADDRFQHNGQTAQHNGHPSNIKGQGLDPHQAAKHRRTGQRQKHNILPDAAQLQKRLQLFHNAFHEETPLFHTQRGIGILYL